MLNMSQKVTMREDVSRMRSIDGERDSPKVLEVVCTGQKIEK